MSCHVYAEMLDRRGRRHLAAEQMELLAGHLESCNDCHQEKNRREVVRLALELAGRGGKIEHLAEPGRIAALVHEAARQNALHERESTLLAEVVPIARRWAPRLAAAALLVLSISVTLWRQTISGTTAGEIVTALLVPEEAVGSDPILDAVLNTGGRP